MPLSPGVRWPEIRARIFRRIDPISAAGRSFRAERLENVTLYEGHARFTGPRTLDTGTGDTITADQVVIAAGSRAVVPDIAGKRSASMSLVAWVSLPGIRKLSCMIPPKADARVVTAMATRSHPPTTRQG